MNKIDLTYGGKIKGLFNVVNRKNFEVRYTVEGKTGKVTTTSILVKEEPMEMITFDYQDLKKLVEEHSNE